MIQGIDYFVYKIIILRVLKLQSKTICYRTDIVNYLIGFTLPFNLKTNQKRIFF